jgi:chromosome segregation ATPase
VLKSLGKRSSRVDLVLLALQGNRAGFEDVIQLIAKMEKTLHHEQQQDDKKRDYCNSEIDKTEDAKKELEHSIEVSGTAIEELQGTITTVQEDMKTLKAGIEDLDKSVAEATKIRKEQNTEFKALEKENIAAKEVLRWAKNRLNKFYNPKLYTAESSDAAEALVETSADGAPPPPPETFGAYTKKTEESSGVIAMVTKIIQDIDVTMAEAKTEEKDSQEDYQELMSNAGSKRTADSKALTEKAASLAEAEEALQAEVEKKAGLVEEREQTTRTLMNLHGECDWILKYFDVRRQARDDELDALGKARDVLHGADYSL